MKVRQRAYARHVEGAIREGLKESPWEQLQWQLVLGGREFVEAIRSNLGGPVREQPQRRASGASAKISDANLGCTRSWRYHRAQNLIQLYQELHPFLNDGREQD